jgi:hypothetical protein
MTHPADSLTQPHPADSLAQPPHPVPEPESPSVDRSRNGRGRFRTRRLPHDADDGVAGSRAELVSELLLLREENARLKASQHELPNLGSLLKQARALPSTQLVPDDLADEAAQMLLEGLVLRESLLAVCHEIERSMAAVKTRLAEMAEKAPEDVAALRPVAGGGVVPTDPTLEEVAVDGAGEA